MNFKRIIGVCAVIAVIALFKGHTLYPLARDYYDALFSGASTTADADTDKVVQRIIADKAKLQDYCAVQAAHKQLEEAEARHDAPKAEELRKSFASLSEGLDPDYRKQLDRVTQAVQHDKPAEARAIATSLSALDKQCAAL